MLHVVDPTAMRGVTLGAQAVSQDPGFALLKKKTCAACHSIDGRPGIGPTFKGLYTHAQKLTDGSEVVADENYIRESVRNPNAKVVEGFQPVMPVLPVTDEELEQIIAYLKTLQ